MATTAKKPRTPAAEAARCDALSEVLAESWWMVGLRGILGIVFGLICLFETDIALMSLILLFSAYLLVDGLFAIAAGIRNARNGERWGLLLLEGFVDIAAAAVAFLWPGLTLVVLIWIIAIWAIISGALMLSAAFTLKQDHGRWWLALGGICLADLRRPAGHCPAGRRLRADLVARRLCADLRRGAAGAGLPAPFQIRSALGS